MALEAIEAIEYAIPTAELVSEAEPTRPISIKGLSSLLPITGSDKAKKCSDKARSLLPVRPFIRPAIRRPPLSRIPLGAMADEGRH